MLLSVFIMHICGALSYVTAVILSALEGGVCTVCAPLPVD